MKSSQEHQCRAIYFLFNNTLLPYTSVGSGITRALGEGINVDYTNNEKDQEFKITVWRENSNQVESASNQVGNEVAVRSNQVESVTSKSPLTNKQKDIVIFCSVPRTTAEIMARLRVSNQTKNHERYVTSLVTAGYLEMTNPDNPAASNQKYRKVNKKNN